MHVGGFQNPGVCLQAFPSFPSPSPPSFNRSIYRPVILCSQTAQKCLLRRLGGKACAKGVTTIQIREFELWVALTMQKYDWLMLGLLTTCQHSRYSENRKAGQSVGFVAPRLAGRPWKELNIYMYEVFCLATLFTSNPKVRVIVISLPSTMSATSSKNSSLKYELTELGLSALHLRDWTGLSLETSLCYWQTCHWCWMRLDDLLLVPITDT